MKASKNLITILAAAAILLSAWVYYMSKINESVTDSEREFQQITKQSTSNDTESIESDLNNTNFEDMDKELLEIEAELK